MSAGKTRPENSPSSDPVSNAASNSEGELRLSEFELINSDAVNEPPAPDPLAPDPIDSSDNQANKRRGKDTGKTLSILSRQGFRPQLIRWKRQLGLVNAFESKLMAEPDSDLRKRSLAIRYRAMAGEKLSTILPEAYALTREAGRRALSMRHYDVQIIGGIALFEGYIAEMQTGEGKTLTATLPLYLHSLTGKGAAPGDRQRLLSQAGCRVDGTAVRNARGRCRHYPNPR